MKALQECHCLWRRTCRK